MQRRHLIAALARRAGLARQRARRLSRPARSATSCRCPPAAAATSSAAPSPSAGARLLGQSFVVENIGGGGGAIACQTTAKAAPDGYTLLQGYVATHGTSPATRSKLPYDAIKDFTPIGMIGGTPNVLVVNASLPVTRRSRIHRLPAQANPGTVSYGSAGQGSLTHLTMELFKQSADTVRRAHRRTAASRRPSTTCSAARRRPCSRAWPRRCRTSARARVRPLAVTGTTRHPLLKDVPTLVEDPASRASMRCSGTASSARPACRRQCSRRSNDTLITTCSPRPTCATGWSAEAVEPMPMTPEAVRPVHPRRHRALDQARARPQDRTRLMTPPNAC